jgi:hypothetical protein
MKNLKIIISVALINLFFVSCNDDDTIESLPKNLGVYELQSLESNKEIDLDYDGVASTDFKHELQLLWFSVPFRQQLHHLELLESETKGKYWLRTDGIPRDDYNGPYQDFNVRFKFEGRSSYVYIENGEIVSFEELEPYLDPLDPDDILGKPRPYSINFDTDDNITMEMTQYFYDIQLEEWTQVNLVAKFDKIQENL